MMKKLLPVLLILLLALFSCASGGSAKGMGEGADMEDETEDNYNPNKDPNVEKFCALTFDDGPSTTQTAKVLDRLEKYGVPATFFVVGQRLNDSAKATIDRALSLGCEYENHSYDYNGMEKLNADQIKEKISKTTALIEKYTGTTPSFFRPPNLATSDAMFENIPLVFAGGVVGNDWVQTTTAEQRAAAVLSGMQDGTIILLHDVQPEPHPTPEALDILIPELKARGFKFVTLKELFEIKGYADLSTAPRKVWKYVK